MYQKQRRFIAPVFLVGLLVLSFFSALITPSAIVSAADPYTAESNGGSCKQGDTPYDDTSVPGVTKKMCRPASGATPTQPTQDEKGQDGNEDETTCAVEKIGWMLCPVIEGAAKMSDRLFDFLANSLLEIEPELFSVNNSGSGKVNGTYNAWTQAKDLANVAFIIAFVIIVISQVTNYGIGNYGIKRMLPRLIIAAIFVNISYFICQGMADISNILGYNVHQALTDIAKSVGPTPFENTQGVNTQTSDGFLGKIALAVLAIAGIVWLLLAPLGAVILFIVITVLTIVIILLLRKAFIVILVVISPLAFVAYLLPNTEQYFKKWLTMFWKLLLVFPIVALLMGGGQLASALILSTGADTQQAKPSANCKTTDNKDSNSKGIDEGNPCEGTVELTSSTGDTKHVRWSLGLIAAGVAVAPLLAVWSVLQGALSAAGAIGGRITSAVQKGVDKGSRGTAGWAGKNTSIGRGLAVRKAIKQNYKDQKFAERMSASGKRGALTRTMARGAGGNIGSLANKVNNPLINKVTGGLRAQDSKLTANFAGAAAKIQDQEVKDKEIMMRTADNPIKSAAEELQRAIEHGDAMGAKAAQNVLMSSGGKGMDEFVQTMVNHEAKGSAILLNTLKQNALQNHGNTMKEKSGVAATWAATGSSVGQVRSGVAGNAFAGLNDEQIAKQTSSSLQAGLRNGWVDRSTAQRITTTSAGENLGQDVRKFLEDYANHGTVPPPTSP